MASRVSKNVTAQTLKPKAKPRIPISRPLKEAAKPQVTVSTSNILRRKPLKENYSNRRSRRYGRGVSQLEDDLLLNIQDQVASSRADLQSTSICALDQTRAELVDSLENIQISGLSFHDNILAQRNQLLSPLVNETTETVYKQGSRYKKVVMNIGKRMENFDIMVAETQDKIKGCWADWEVVQRKIIELGVDVLGCEEFPGGMGNGQSGSRGYRKEMEILDVGEKAFREDIENELRLLGCEAMNKMKVKEKELTVTLKKQKAEFFAKLLEEDD